MKAKQESKAFRSADAEVFVSIVKTADSLIRQFERLLRPFGITTTQYNTLRILRGAGEEGATCSHIAERLITNDPDVTRLLDRMEKSGLIERARSTTDRRVVMVKISKDGLSLLGKLDGPVDELHQKQFSAIGKRDAKALVEQLELIRSHVEEQE